MGRLSRIAYPLLLLAHSPPTTLHIYKMAVVPPLTTYPPIDRRAELKALIRAKQSEQSDLQRGILEDMAHISEEECERRRALSAAMDDEMDVLLEEYKAISAAQGIAPTPRGPAPTPRRQKITPRKAITRPPSTVITRPTGAVKGGGAQIAHSTTLTRPPVQPPKQVPVPATVTQDAEDDTQTSGCLPKQIVVDADKMAVHINPLSDFSIVVNI